MDKYCEHAPFTWKLLHTFAATPNKFRKQKEKKKSTNTSEGEDDDWEDDPNLADTWSRAVGAPTNLRINRLINLNVERGAFRVLEPHAPLSKRLNYSPPDQGKSKGGP